MGRTYSPGRSSSGARLACWRSHTTRLESCHRRSLRRKSLSMASLQRYQLFLRFLLPLCDPSRLVSFNGIMGDVRGCWNDMEIAILQMGCLSDSIPYCMKEEGSKPEERAEGVSSDC